MGKLNIGCCAAQRVLVGLLQTPRSTWPFQMEWQYHWGSQCRQELNMWGCLVQLAFLSDVLTCLCLYIMQGWPSRRNQHDLSSYFYICHTCWVALRNLFTITYLWWFGGNAGKPSLQWVHCVQHCPDPYAVCPEGPFWLPAQTQQTLVRAADVSEVSRFLPVCAVVWTFCILRSSPPKSTWRKIPISLEKQLIRRTTD